MAKVGLRPEHYTPLSAHVLRRPAPAHRHCARPDAQSPHRGGRRTGLGPRCFDPCPGAEPADGSAGGVSASPISSSPTISRSSAISPTRSWSCIWAAPPSRATRRRSSQRPAPPLYARTPGQHAGSRSQGAGKTHRPARRTALTDRPPNRLCFPQALPPRHGRMRGQEARVAAGRPAAGGLPLRRNRWFKSGLNLRHFCNRSVTRKIQLAARYWQNRGLYATKLNWHGIMSRAGKRLVSDVPKGFGMAGFERARPDGWSGIRRDRLTARRYLERCASLE